MAMSREQQDEQAKVYGRIVAKAWTDESFKQRLLSDTAAVLKAEGVAIAEGTAVHMVENTDQVIHVILPAKPAGTLSDEQLGQVAGGSYPFPGIGNRNPHPDE